MENTITTLVGNMSNWIGSHFLKSIEPKNLEDHLFGQFYRDPGDCDRPRVISVDLKSNIVLPKLDLKVEEEKNNWENLKVIDKSLIDPLSLYSWTNCLNSSIIQDYYDKDFFQTITEYVQTPEKCENISESSFDAGIFHYYELAHEDVKLENLENSLRKLSEEADFISSFNILYDSTNGFSGMFHWLAGYLSNEYSKKCAFTFPVIPKVYIEKLDDIALYNLARSINTSESNDDFLSNSAYFPILFDHSNELCSESLKIAQVITNQYIPIVSGSVESRKLINEMLETSFNKKMFSQSLFNKNDDNFTSLNYFESDVNPETASLFICRSEENQIVLGGKCKTYTKFDSTELKFTISCKCRNSESPNTLICPTGISKSIRNIYQRLFKATSTISPINKRIRLPKDDMEAFHEEFYSRIYNSYVQRDE